MNRRSDAAAGALLDPLGAAQRERLVSAMDEVHRLLRLAALRIEPVDPGSADARWCLQRYFDELGRRFEGGFDPAASLAAADREMAPPGGAFLVASVDGEPVACGGVKTIAPGVGYLKRMWVADGVRGLGLGRRMLEALEARSRDLGHATLRLETNRALTEALQLYRSAGFRDVPQFNSDPYGDHWLEKRLT
jgi:GNAT superfamily N-acetyltransferase